VSPAPQAALLERVGLDLPIVQAGLGGGLSGAVLAAAVSRAGGLGTVGMASPRRMTAELEQARGLAPGRPLAANLLVPFLRRAHVDALAAARPEVAVLFCGFQRGAVERLRAAGIVVLHQVGTEAQARRALADGADGLIAQGIQAGGHLLGERDTLDFLGRAVALAAGRPVLAAGGIHDAEGVRRALEAGAAAVACGTRFLLTQECAAHPLYKQRALGASETLDTRLFGFGWPTRHRVVPNAATRRWCSRRPDGPRLAALANRLGEPLARRLPMSAAPFAARAQRRFLPIYSPAPLLAGMPDALVELTPLYAGVCARDIHAVLPAADAVAALAGR
jgi:nitronate monooxygenase